MFSQLFLYELKQSLRVKEIIFWNLAFPIILSTLFFLTVSNIDSSDVVKEIPVAVQDQELWDILEGIEVDSGAKLYTRAIDGDFEEMLKKGEIDGIVTKEDEDYQVLINRDGTNESILINTIDLITHQKNLVNDIVTEAMEENLDPSRLSVLSEHSAYETVEIKNVMNASEQKTMNVYYYSLLAMVCMGASSLGVTSVVRTNTFGDMEVSKRLAVSPVKRSKILYSLLMAALVTSLGQVLISLTYMRFVLGIDFGNRYGYLLLGIVFGTAMGIMMGMTVALLVKAGTGVLIGINTGIYIMSSFFAGLMFGGIPSLVESTMPIINRINPGSVLYRYFFSLYYYDNSSIYLNRLGNIIILMAGFLVLVTILVRRRENESL